MYNSIYKQSLTNISFSGNYKNYHAALLSATTSCSLIIQVSLNVFALEFDVKKDLRKQCKEPLADIALCHSWHYRLTT